MNDDVPLLKPGCDLGRKVVTVGETIPCFKKLARVISDSPNLENEESQLIERLKAGDELALETMVTLYSTKLYSLAIKILGDAEDCEEIIQDVFFTACRKVKSFRGQSRFYTWLYRLTVNCALVKLRRRKTRMKLALVDSLSISNHGGDYRRCSAVDGSDNPEESYAKRQLLEFVIRVVSKLTPINQRLLILSDLEGFSDKEIAELLGLSVAAVKTRKLRARLFARNELTSVLGYTPV